MQIDFINCRKFSKGSLRFFRQVRNTLDKFMNVRMCWIHQGDSFFSVFKKKKQKKTKTLLFPLIVENAFLS